MLGSVNVLNFQNVNMCLWWLSCVVESELFLNVFWIVNGFLIGLNGI